jgi:hypothetical protein
VFNFESVPEDRLLLPNRMTSHKPILWDLKVALGYDHAEGHAKLTF